jgi:Prokaryotic RING finger family 1
MAQLVVDAGSVGKPCPYCRFPLKSGMTAESCDACSTIHHRECWEEGGGCAVFGCVNAGVQAASPSPPSLPPPVTRSPRTVVTPAAGAAARGFSLPPEYRFGIDLAGLPLELWLVIGLLAAAGLYLVQASLRSLPDTVRLFTYDYFPHGLAFVLLVLVLLLGAVGVGLLWLGWQLRRGSRVARGLTYVAAGSLFGAVLFGTGVTTGQTLAMLAGLAAAGTLAFAPAVQPIFTGADAPDADHPAALVVARVSLAIWLGFLAVAALLDFSLAGIDGKYVAIGLLEGGVVAGGIAVYRRLGLADPRARVIATAGAGLAFILLLFGRHDVGFGLMTGLTAAIPVCLWVPAQVRAYYGESPLLVARQGE